MKPYTALLLIALPLALAGCGNKGPLVLPPKPIPVDPATLPEEPGTPPADTAPASDEPADATTSTDSPVPTTPPSNGDDD